MHVQYDDQTSTNLGRKMGLRTSQDFFNTPEYASEDHKVWTPKETYENVTLANMQIPDYIGGKYVLTEMDSRRVNQIRTYDLIAGDLLLWEEFKGDCQVAVFDGENLLHLADGKLRPMTQEEMDRFLIYRFFIGLRPVQAL